MISIHYTHCKPDQIPSFVCDQVIWSLLTPVPYESMHQAVDLVDDVIKIISKNSFDHFLDTLYFGFRKDQAASFFCITSFRQRWEYIQQITPSNFEIET